MLDYRYLCIGTTTGIFLQDQRLKASAMGFVSRGRGLVREK